MKLKKIIISVLCFICIFSLVGCNKRDVNLPAITMSRYFKSTVVSRYNNANTDYKLSSFTAESADTSTIKLHRNLKFTGITNWIYNMEIECVYFYFYSTKSIEVNQLVFTMTALDGGLSDDTLNNYKVQETLAFNAEKNDGVLLRVNIGHRVTMDDLTMTIALEDENLVNMDFGWTIYGLQVYGDM